MVPVPAAKTAGISLRCQASHPPTLQMVKEALRAHDEKKGASVVAIKRFILAKYPTVDPIRLKYLLKRALSKGLSCGDLVRPHNSSAVGATGTFKLARKKPGHKQQLGQADPDRGQAPKPGQKGSTKDPQAPVAGARPRGVTKQQPKVKPEKAQPRAAEKPRSNRTKHPQSADRPQAPGKGRSGPSTARAAQNAGESDSDSSSSAGAEAKAPRGKGKGKVPKGAQQEGAKAQGGHNKVKKPRATAGAGQGKARVKKAAPVAADRKAP
ncbi:histone H1.8 [Melozone crissalis]|uniref:histone H1.8 n=1 Tax=Melozone crissalis TaxID=40204 RepID=UPI0023DA982F|nr:histone H1.8 [Melozone crissalis]